MRATDASIQLPPDAASPCSAREFVSTTLRGYEIAPETIDTARLLTSELVTNAVVHARSPIELSVRVTDHRVRVEVSDESALTVGIQDAGEETQRGRGLTIVSRLARGWGVEHRAAGKTVWFELSPARA